MNIPAIPMGTGQAVTGKVSWFGGPNDSTDSGHTASGATTATPGIAVYNRATLGGYWKVTDTKTGRSAVLKQTDLGPAPFTGRKIDVTYSALNRFGYGEHNFPTDSTFKAEYLGHNPATTAPATPTVASPAAKVPSIPGVQLDQAAFQQAQRQSLVGKLIASGSGGEANNPLFTSGLVSTKAPDPSEYTKTAPAAPKVPSAAAPSTGGGSGPGAGAVAFATERLGHYKESEGQNLGPELDTLEQRFGDKGEPWCAMFATVSASHGGASMAVRTASVADINKWASEGTHGYMHGLLPASKARPGDLLTFGDQHVALVKEVTPQGIVTIEGNADGSGGVTQLHHTFNEGQIARPYYKGR
ncbi:MAG TPA: hypothetical protein VK730_13675 [Solirubrobacteraceae bacterium]|nr:hypothetical protein [Solirubrobacteraceae bacterium]